jgi:diguanylate cyclase (GGDEF)-like protein
VDVFNTTETHVLIYCANEARLQPLKALFNISGLHSQTVTLPDELERKADSGKVDVILIIAAEAPDDELALCQRLQSSASAAREIPLVVVFTEDTPVEQALLCLQLGAYDYLIEPFNEIQVLSKIAVLARVKHAEDEFRNLAIRDRLTGLYDRTYLNLRFNEEFSRARRYDKPISCLTIKLDNLEEININHGGEAGEFSLKAIASLLSQAKREIDVLARGGANEFVLVLYNTDSMSASVLSSRIMKKAFELALPFNHGLKISLSIGLADALPGSETALTVDDLFLRAQQACDQAQHTGGGTTVVYNNSQD